MGSFVAGETVVLLAMLATAVAAGASVVEEETLVAKENGSVWETANAFEASATTSVVYAPVDGGCMIALEELWARIDDRPDCRKAIATRQGDCPVSGALVDECAAFAKTEITKAMTLCSQGVASQPNHSLDVRIDITFFNGPCRFNERVTTEANRGLTYTIALATVAAFLMILLFASCQRYYMSRSSMTFWPASDTAQKSEDDEEVKCLITKV